MSLLFNTHMYYYPIISKLYQKIYDKKYIGYPSFSNLSPENCKNLLDIIIWRKDGLKELNDAFHHPNAGDYIIYEILRTNRFRVDGYDLGESIKLLKNKDDYFDYLYKIKKGLGQPNISFDCDDFALWAARSMKEEYIPKVLTIAYKEKIRLSGHNICIFQENKKFGHLSNWYLKKDFNSIKDIIDDACKFAGKRYVGHKVWNKEELLAF